MHKTVIKKNPYGDTRTAPSDYDFEKFQKANHKHRHDVYMLMHELGVDIMNAGERHDITKVTREQDFWRDFCNKMENPDLEFTDMPWYKMHVAAERHHLSNNVPDDVDLIDVIEMICDVVAASLARSGQEPIMSFHCIFENTDLLNRAAENTALKVIASCEVEES